MTPQPELDFTSEHAALEARLHAQWQANQKADAHNWTPEAMAMVWALGVSDWEAWCRLPSYERSQIMALYNAEQIEIEFTGRRTIRTYAEAVAKWCPPADKEVERLEQDIGREDGGSPG